MTKWKLTDAYEMGYEYECPFCGRHIGVRFKGKDLPDDCPYCGSKMTEVTKKEAIQHFEYGVSHDIFSEPVNSYAKMAIAALREQGGSFQNGNDHNTVKDWPPYMDLPREQETVTNRNGLTNADHIRSMTDEELAAFLECFRGCHYCSENERLENEPLLRGERCDEDCEQHMLDWLKQPYKEDLI